MSGVASVVLLTLDKIEVHLDFHIYNILNFDLFLGYPLEKLLASHGSLDEMLRENAFATAAPCLENLMAKHFPEQNLLEEMVHTSPFISSEPVLLEDVESFEESDSKDSLHFVKMNVHRPPRSSVSLFPLALNMLFSVFIEIQLRASTINLLRWRNYWPRNFVRRRL